MPHYENVISNFYQYFFDPGAEHGMGSLFVETLLEIIGHSNFFDDIDLTVIREESTQDGGRIDLVIRDRKGNALVIENKIYHHAFNDFKDYWESVKSPTGKRAGVILALQNDFDENQVPSYFIRVTHGELAKRISEKLKTWTFESERQKILVEDFIQSLLNLTIDSTMNDQTKFYFENVKNVIAVVECQKEAKEFVHHQIDILATELGMLTKRGTDRFRHIWRPENEELYYTILIESLWNSDLRLSIIIEAWRGAFEQREKLLATVSDPLKPGVYKSGKMGINWAHLFSKDLTLSVNELVTLSAFLKENIKNDFEAIFEVLTETYKASRNDKDHSSE
jgi:hypothetical protein